MRILKRLRSNRGFSYVMTSVMMIAVLLIGTAVFEIIRVNVEAAAVRDKFEDAIIYASRFQLLKYVCRRPRKSGGNLEIQ